MTTRTLQIIFTLGFFALSHFLPLTTYASYSAPYGEGYYYGQGYYYGEGYYYGYGQGYYYGYGQGYYQGSYTTTISGNFGVSGNVTVTSNLGKGSGSFVIDHPLDPRNKLLFHSFVESPDVKNLYDGQVTLDEKGEAVVILPSYFEVLNEDFRYQLRGFSGPMPSLYVKEEVRNNRFSVSGGIPHGTISWQVTGNRKDPYIRANPIIPEVDKTKDTYVPRGEYLHPELYQESLWLRVRSLLDRIF